MGDGRGDPGFPNPAAGVFTPAGQAPDGRDSHGASCRGRRPRAGTIFPQPGTWLLPARSRRFASARLLLDVVGRSSDYRTMRQPRPQPRRSATGVPRRSSSNWVGPSSLAPSDALLGNPVALKRAFEGGGDPCAGPARFPALTCMPSQVKLGALRVGEDLAVTSGAVLYHRDAVCEVIQPVVAY
jgi:hypothetical protein